MSVPETDVKSEVPGLDALLPGVPSSNCEVPESVRLPVTAFDPIELPGAQIPCEATVLPAPKLIVPMPPTVWFEPNVYVPVRAVRSSMAPDDPALPIRTTPLLGNVAVATPIASVPPAIVVSPVYV